MDVPDKIPAFLLPYRGEKLLAGFSGGCDSTALLLLLHRWGWRGALLEAVHFDHGLRGEASRQDALWCEDFCRARDIAFRKIELRLAPGPDLEAAARASRLAYYRRIAPVAVALAHHADDAAETLLLRLARGSNVSALAALRPVRKLGQVTLLRPLLGRRRAELEAFLRSEGVTDWRNDASNRDNHFARNRLRNELLPALYRALPPARKGLLRALSALTLDAEYLEQCAEEKLREIGDARVTPTAFWRGLPPALLARVLRRHLERHLGDGVLLSGAMTERFVRELHTAHPGGARFHLGRGAAFRIAGNRLELLAPEAPPSRLPAECRWEWRREPECRWGDWLLSARTREDPNDSDGRDARHFDFDAELLPNVLYAGPRRAGETIAADGGTRRLKHLFANHPLPVAPVVLRDGAGKVLAVPGVRRGDAAKVTPKTVEVVRISAEILPNEAQKQP